MGQMLSEPLTAKQSSSLQNKLVKVGSSSMQGWRISMEDAHTQGLEPELICEELMTRCLASDSSMGGLGCDNMTVILICFLHNQPYQKLIDECIEIEKIRDRTRQELLEKEANEEEDEEAKDDDDTAKDTVAPNGN